MNSEMAVIKRLSVLFKLDTKRLRKLWYSSCIERKLDCSHLHHIDFRIRFKIVVSKANSFISWNYTFDLKENE